MNYTYIIYLYNYYFLKKTLYNTRSCLVAVRLAWHGTPCAL